MLVVLAWYEMYKLKQNRSSWKYALFDHVYKGLTVISVHKAKL